MRENEENVYLLLMYFNERSIRLSDYRVECSDGIDLVGLVGDTADDIDCLACDDNLLGLAVLLFGLLCLNCNLLLEATNKNASKEEHQDSVNRKDDAGNHDDCSI